MTPDEEPLRGTRVAIVGSGIAGLTACYVLAGSGADVTLFERESEPGMAAFGPWSFVLEHDTTTGRSLLRYPPLQSTTETATRQAAQRGFSSCSRLGEASVWRSGV